MTRNFSRRQALQAGFAGAGAVAALQFNSAAVAQQRRDKRNARTVVNAVADGLMLSPADYVARLAGLSSEGTLAMDDYSRGGAVAALERAFAQLLAKEAAIFMPTGTLANHLALRALCARGERVLVQQESHLYNDSGDCAQTLSALTLVPLARGAASFRLEDVQQELTHTQSRRVQTRVGAISIESPVRRCSGEMFSLHEMRRISQFARSAGIRLHLDGARLLIASAYSGVAPAEYAALFDTVYVSLYKGLNAASGAILAGPKDLLDEMYHVRRMFGAGLPGAWPFAAVALAELPGFHNRLRHAIDVSEEFLRILGADGRISVTRIPEGTNIVRLGNIEPGEFAARLERDGIVVRRVNADARELTVTINESWGTRPAAQIAQQFLRALA